MALNFGGFQNLQSLNKSDQQQAVGLNIYSLIFAAGRLNLQGFQNLGGLSKSHPSDHKFKIMCYAKKAYYQKWGHPHHHPKFDFHRGRRGRRWRKFASMMASAPVNVKEFDDKYELFLYAPGLTKEDFELSIEDNLLTIKAKRVEEELVEHSTWHRREYRPGGFQRRFELNEKVDKNGISAAYEGGILVVTIPKLEGFETVRQNIEVA